MTALQELLNSYRQESKTEREKGTYFELLIKDFLKNDPTYSPNFSDVWTYAEWATIQGIDSRDAGIDLVAKLAEDDGYCAIQCKFYDENYRIQKSDIDSFFTASGKKDFTRRLIVDSTRKDWSEHAEAALQGQAIETQRIGLAELENSPIDWSVYTPSKGVKLKSKKELREHQVNALEAVKKGLAEADRGKLVMACGTGKTFTGLKIAETLAGGGKQVLFLVPSLSLMSQTITEWTIETKTELRSYAVCSDNQVGKRKNADDLADINVHAETITKEDIFYYIYGLLHSEDYKKRYADNLTKELPRIPCVKRAEDFWAFSKAGRELAELHINYETVTPYPVNFAGGSLFMDSFEDKDYRVEQMKFSKKGKETDKSTVIYNNKITMTGIPLEAYDYVVNGKPALEWVMERQAVTTHKDSGIVNDANDWAIETMGDAAYPLKLFQRVITVSLETMKIVRALPRLDIAVSKS